ncbi:MAG: glycosyltransferase family 2 protein [Armatimonadetes bacterium]|nr:glycosyltransferase family 2 protein [Armatimonadota bacterium]
MADLSVCIVNWNTREHLKACLESLYAHAEGLELEVIVVDNASSDGSAAMVRESFPRVCLVANENNEGYARGNNQALARASAEYALLLNPDTRVQDGTLRGLLDCAKRHPRAAAVAPRLVYPDGRLQHSCRAFPTPDVVLYELTGLSRLAPRSRIFGKYRMTWWDYNEERPVDQPMASALLVRKVALDEVGYFDEAFPIFFNDVDLCKRFWDAGWEIWFTPSAVVTHFHGASTHQVRRAMIAESHKSWVRFYEKHYRGRISPIAYWSTLLSLEAARLVRSAWAMVTGQ